MIIRNGMLFLVARLVPGMLAVATTSILTRLLTPDAYGSYGLTLIIMSFGSTIAFEWLGLSFMRFYEARQHDRRTIPTFVMLYYAMVGLTALVLAAAALSTLLPIDQVALFAVGLCMAWSFAFFELLARFEVVNFRPVRYLMLNLGRAALLMGFHARRGVAYPRRAGHRDRQRPRADRRHSAGRAADAYAASLPVRAGSCAGSRALWSFPSQAACCWPGYSPAACVRSSLL